MLQRVKEVQESDLRMVGALARNIQRVIAVTQADIDAAAAQGKAWVVKPVVKVSDPLDNLRGGTQLVIKQNAILPGQNVMRVMYIGGQAVVVGPGTSPLPLPDATDNDILSLIAFGGTEQRNLPDNYIQRDYIYIMSGAYLLTDIVPTYDYKIEMDFKTTTVSASKTVLGGRAAVYGGTELIIASSKNFVVDAFGTGSADRYSSSVTAQNNTRYKFTYANQVATLESGGSTLFTNTMTGTAANGAALCINGNNDSGTVSGVGEIYLYSFKVWNGQGELVADYVPAVQKDTVPVVGFYDTVSKTFKTATAGTIAAGTETVPTPDAPMDIVSNNGVLKARHQSGLPLGYTLLEYINTNGGYLDLNYIFTTNNQKKVIKFKDVAAASGSSSPYAICGTQNGFARTAYLALKKSGKIGLGVGSQGAGASSLEIDNPSVPVTVVIETKSDNSLVFSGGSSSYDTTWSGSVQTGSSEFLGKLNITSGTYSANVDVYEYSLYADGALVRELVPVRRNSDNELGMYDLVSGQFFTNAGTGDFVAGNPVSDPVEIYTDGTVETIKDSLDNTATAEMLLSVGDYTDEQEIISGVVTRKVGVKVLDGTETGWTKLSGIDYVSLPKTAISNMVSGTDATCLSNSFVQVPHGSISLSEECFSVGASYVNFKKAGDPTVAQFKQWLADQYAAGTPVIIVFPLATPTTESVAGQTLQVQDGDNTLEITQASIDGLELEAEYEKEA